MKENETAELGLMLKSVEPEQLRAYIEGYAIQHARFCVELKAWLMSLNPDD